MSSSSKAIATPSSAARRHGPAPKVNCSRSACAVVGSLAPIGARTPAPASTVRPAPSTCSAAATACASRAGSSSGASSCGGGGCLAACSKRPAADSGALTSGTLSPVGAPRLHEAEDGVALLVGGVQVDLDLEALVVVAGRVIEDLPHPPQPGPALVPDQQRGAAGVGAGG